MSARNERGFTAAEILIAAVIVTVAFVALARIVPLAGYAVQEGNQLSTATFLADQRLEQIRGVPWTSVPANDCLGISVSSTAAADGSRRRNVHAWVHDRQCRRCPDVGGRRSREHDQRFLWLFAQCAGDRLRRRIGLRRYHGLRDAARDGHGDLYPREHWHLGGRCAQVEPGPDDREPAMMSDPTTTSERGYTLAELLVAMAVLVLLLGGLLLTLQGGQTAYLFGAGRVEVQQNARVGLERMLRELRTATTLVGGARSLSFTYYDANNTPLSSPVTASSVYGVGISLTTQTQDSSLASSSPANRQAVVAGRVRLRNE